MTRLFAIACLTVVAAVSVATEPSRSDRILSELDDPNGRVLVAAHRGDWRNFPENSLRAIRSAIEIGCDIVEIDIRTTQDGRFVVIHDKTLNRTTTGSGKVNHHTLAEIKELRLLNGYGMPTEETVPTLEEAFEECRGLALVYVDKSEHSIPEVFAVAGRLGVERQVLFYGSLSADQFKAELGTLSPHINYLPKLGDDTVNADYYVESFQGHAPAFVTSFSSEHSQVLDLLPSIQKNGVRLWASSLWSDLCAGRTDDRALDDPQAAWGWLIDRGASILCTDRPEQLIEYLKSRGGRED